ncbi:MAG: DUF4294 domain-containing protein [Schleiferiaceae bacterium]|nr:DUF4294 domain-containing protein [Schleiferiaceae bacterium]
MPRIIVILFLGCLGWPLLAQPDTTNLHADSLAAVRQDSITAYILENRKNIYQMTVIDGDTISWAVLDEIMLISTPTFDDDEARRRYLLLKRRVYKVYPYAVIAGDKLDSLNLQLMDIRKKRQRKKAIKEYQKYLEDQFEPELKKLTRSEGQILCKLIYRETGYTVYELISEYRSNWKAFWYNALANWYDITLKKEYNPEASEEDKMIENILQIAFRNGYLEERTPFFPPPK